MVPYVRTYEDGLDYIESVGGVDWYDAPVPLWWERCTPQTRALMSGHHVERCACGATRGGPDERWLERNHAPWKRRQRKPITRLTDYADSWFPTDASP